MSRRDDIANDLVAAIDHGEYQPGDRLPSEHALARRYGVSRLTARDALVKLANDGRAESEHGRGWFVRGDHRLAFPLLQLDRRRVQALRDVWHTWLDAERLPGSARLQVLVDRPPRHVRQHLHLNEDGWCAIRRRVRSIQERPIMVSTGYFPMWLAEGSDLARPGEGDEVDLQDPSPLALLHQMGYGPIHDIDLIGARRPTRQETELLLIPRGSPVITVCRTSTDAEGRHVRCTSDVIAGDRLYLTVEQTYPDERSPR